MRALPILFLFCACRVLAGEDVVAENAWMRAMPPGQVNSAAYGRLDNRGEVSHTVVGVSSPAARAVEIHRSRREGGMWRMERLEQLALPPGESVELTPGGIHLMVFGLTHSPQPEEEVAFELELDNGEIIRMIARVQAVGAAAHHH